jgi:hypothetical protein
MSVEFYGEKQKPLAIVIRSTEKVSGIEFFSPVDFSQQIGLMSRPKGYKVAPHTHNEIKRTIFNTQEVLFVRYGKCKVTLYDYDQSKVAEIVLLVGDAILLAAGGHGIEMLSDTEILEVKQGPHLGAEDKTHF